MRFGINVIPEEPISDIVALAVYAEQLGIERCWVYDEGLVTRDVWVVLSAIAAATEHLVLGPGITNPYTRHPAQTASAAASLHELSGGRAFLGIGAGGSLTLGPIGLERTRPLTAVRETIDIARRLFTGNAVDHDGSLHTLRSATMPYGDPSIEIWLAGRGPKIVALGAEQADGVMLDFIHRDDLTNQFDRIRTAAATTGCAGGICYSTAIVLDDTDLETVRPHMTYRLVDAPPAIKEAIGLTDDHAATIRSAMSDGLDAAAEHVRDEWIEPFVISGTAAQCSARLVELSAEHHIDEFLLPMFPQADAHGYLERVAAIFAAVANHADS